MDNSCIKPNPYVNGDGAGTIPQSDTMSYYSSGFSSPCYHGYGTSYQPPRKTSRRDNKIGIAYHSTPPDPRDLSCLDSLLL
jgi:hypothetical protein